MARRYRQQPRLKKHETRDELPHAYVIREVLDYVNDDARRYGVSRSWIVACILAKHYKAFRQVRF